MKIISQRISIDEFYEEINFIINFLKENSISSVRVAWGYCCDLDVDEMWKYENIDRDLLKQFISNGVDSDIYLPNESDLFIEGFDNLFEFKMCHESDIHFKSENDDLCASVKSHWTSKNIKFYEK